MYCFRERTGNQDFLPQPEIGCALNCVGGCVGGGYDASGKLRSGNETWGVQAERQTAGFSGLNSSQSSDSGFIRLERLSQQHNYTPPPPNTRLSEIPLLSKFD